MSHLQEILHFGSGVIFRWASDSVHPNTDGLAKVADHFSVSVDYLLGRTNDPIIHQEHCEFPENVHKLLNLIKESGFSDKQAEIITQYIEILKSFK